MNRGWMFIAIWMCVCVAPVLGQDIYNPKPAADDIVLPMPNGGSMVFKRVYIGEGSNQYALREFKVGDRSGGGFKEYPTNVSLGGAFLERNSAGQQDWTYYIGKYEVTEAQYYGIMDPAANSESQAPVSNISWFDALAFVDKYNVWIRKNQIETLPKYEDTYGYFRFPTEVEWEFAARGGNMVSANDFDKKHPYTGELNKFEWFSGTRSSRDQKKNIGLREPNPLGIHDMLGNVSEMIQSLYQLEYYQGRCGGFVARGGNYLTPENKIRSSMRMEIPLYGRPDKDAASRQVTLGFRLVISAPLFASRQSAKDLQDQWDDYVNTVRNPPAPPLVQSAPVTVQTNSVVADAQTALDRLNEELQSTGGISPAIQDSIGQLKASFSDIVSIVNKAEIDSAYAWWKIASEAGFFIQLEMKKLPPLESIKERNQAAGMSAQVEALQKRIDEVNTNISNGLERYGSSFRQMEKSKETSIISAIEKHNEFLRSKSSFDQIKVNNLVEKHLKEYLQSRRADVDVWRQELSSL